jgi:hypothetical protein
MEGHAMPSSESRSEQAAAKGSIPRLKVELSAAGKAGKGKKKAPEVHDQVLDARPDTLDFRDRMFEPTLVEVPQRIPLSDYTSYKVPILDQEKEGACTGFGLATVANYLLRRRRVDPDKDDVSARMFYEMAKRYDEWPGEAYSGSSARGAMKGWHKHGVCADLSWPYVVGSTDLRLTDKRASEALRRPLGAYYRVNHKDLVAMHTALAEVGILYATAMVHQGWSSPGSDGAIAYPAAQIGGHAFAIVAYDEKGFWVQNSWSESWGRKGFGLVTYDDWLANGTDVWVARLGAPVVLRSAQASATSLSAAARQSDAYAFCDVRPHIVATGNDGRLRTDGSFGTSREDVEAIFKESIPNLTKGWKRKRLLLYAHGGLVGEQGAVQRVADYRAALLAAEVYPVAFIWKSDLWSTVRNILEDAARRRRPEGALDAAKDFMLDRFDDALEPLARTGGGHSLWSEIKENARLATQLDAGQDQGGARIALQALAGLVAGAKGWEVHVAGHSAGAVFHAPIVRWLAAHGIPIASCTLWAPACTLELFRSAYLPLIQSGQIGRFALFTLTDQAERDDTCANIYNKSLLYLVSNALDAWARVPLFRDGVPLLGMEKFVRADKAVAKVFASGKADWVLAPNTEPAGSPDASTSRAHGAFDDDVPTLKATLARIVGTQAAKAKKVAAAPFDFHRSAGGLRDTRQRLDRAAPSRALL